MFKLFRERRRLKSGAKIIASFSGKLEGELAILRTDLERVWKSDPVHAIFERFRKSQLKLSGETVTPEQLYSFYERSLNRLRIEDEGQNLIDFKEIFIQRIEFEPSPLADAFPEIFPNNEGFFNHYFSRSDKDIELKLEEACADILDAAHDLLSEMIELKQLLTSSLPEQKKHFKVGFFSKVTNFVCGGINLASQASRLDDTSIIQAISSDLFVDRISKKTAAFREAVEQKSLRKLDPIMDQFNEAFGDLQECADHYHRVTYEGLHEVIGEVMRSEEVYYRGIVTMLQEMLDSGYDLRVLMPILESSCITYHVKAKSGLFRKRHLQQKSGRLSATALK